MEKDCSKRAGLLARAALVLALIRALGLYAPAGAGEGEKEIVTKGQGQEEEESMELFIGEEKVSVDWEENESVQALFELAKEEALTVEMSMYGGFEQVGSLGEDLPRNDVQTRTKAGDIVLYAGDQIVVFYGTNSWAYTRLGHISDKSEKELKGLLGNGDVTLKLQKSSS